MAHRSGACKEQAQTHSQKKAAATAKPSMSRTAAQKSPRNLRASSGSHWQVGQRWGATQTRREVLSQNLAAPGRAAMAKRSLLKALLGLDLSQLSGRRFENGLLLDFSFEDDLADEDVTALEGLLVRTYTLKVQVPKQKVSTQNLLTTIPNLETLKRLHVLIFWTPGDTNKPLESQAPMCFAATPKVVDLLERRPFQPQRTQ